MFCKEAWVKWGERCLEIALELLKNVLGVSL